MTILDYNNDGRISTGEAGIGLFLDDMLSGNNDDGNGDNGGGDGCVGCMLRGIFIVFAIIGVLFVFLPEILP